MIEETFVVPYPRNFQFTGRKVILQTIQEALSAQTPKRNNGRVALYGMGGIGKTQTAIEYVYANRALYNRIYWLTAVDKISLLSGFEKIVKTAQLKIPPELHSAEIAEYVLTWLRQESNWLIIIDNLDDIEIVRGLLPENGIGKHTLITTRNRNAAGIPAEGIEIPLFDRDEAIELLTTLSSVDLPLSPSEKEHAIAIVNELDLLPLAIEQAAAYVREVAWNFKTYRNDYQKSHSLILRWVPKGNRLYSDSVASTWSMSFKMVQELNPYAAELLRVLSFLNPDGALIDFMAAGAEALGLQPLLSNRGELAVVLLELEKFSLIKWNRSRRTIVIHRLMQTIIKDALSESEPNVYFDKIIDLCTQSFAVHRKCGINCPGSHIFNGQILWPLSQAKERRTKAFAMIAGDVGSDLVFQQNYIDSEKLLLQTVDVLTEILGSDHEETSHYKWHLAEAYAGQKRFAKALELQTELWETYKRQFGEDNEVTLSALAVLVILLARCGDMTKAVEFQEKLLEMKKCHQGDECSDVVGTMCNTAFIYRLGGRMAEAVQMQQQAVHLGERILDPDSSEMIEVKDDLACIYAQEGLIGEATELLEHVLERRKRILGKCNIYTLVNMHDLSWLYGRQGRISEARELQSNILEKKKEILDAGDLKELSLLTTRVWACDFQKSIAERERAKLEDDGLFQRSEALIEQIHIFPGIYPDVTCTGHGSLFSEVRVARVEQLGILEEKVRKFGDGHPEALVAMQNLVWTCGTLGLFDQATDLNEKIFEKRLLLSLEI